MQFTYFAVHTLQYVLHPSYSVQVVVWSSCACMCVCVRERESRARGREVKTWQWWDSNPRPRDTVCSSHIVLCTASFILCSSHCVEFVCVVCEREQSKTERGKNLAVVGFEPTPSK